MPRGLVLAMAGTLLLGLVALLLAWSAHDSDQEQTLGVLPVLPVAPLRSGQEACQTPIGLAEDLRRVRFNIGTQGKPGTALDVTVRAPSSGEVLGAGRVAPGWVDDGTAQSVSVGDVRASRFVSVCIRNRGPITAYVFGDVYKGDIGAGPIGVRPTVTTSYATIGGRRIPGDLSIAFVSSKPHSLLSRVPSIFRHASLFRPSGIGPWTFWLLLLGVVLVAPLALWRALVRTERDDVERAGLES